MKQDISKGASYSKALDSARCVGTWLSEQNALANIPLPHGVKAPLSWPELLRKFKKHNPDQSLSVESVTLEKFLYERLAETSFGKHTELDRQDFGYRSFSDEKSPCDFPLPQIIPSSETDKIEAQIRSLRSSLESSKNDTSEHITSAKIILAQALYLISRPQDAIEILDSISLISPFSSLPSEDHSKDLLLIALVINCFANELTNDSQKYLQSYAALPEACDACFANRSFYSDALNWVEEAFYRYVLVISPKSENSQTILKAHRDYINFTSKYCKPRFRPSRRGNIYRSFINILVQSHRQNSYFPPPLSNIPSEFSDSQSGVDQFTIAWRAEWAQLLTQYEKHLSYTDAKNFPRAGTVNKPILDLVDRAYEGWRVSGSLTDDASRLAQLLYRTISQTFHSQRILRHLLPVLIKLRAFDEACNTLELYVQIHKKTKETHSDEVAQEVAVLRQKSFEENREDTSIILSQGDTDIDRPEHVVKTLLIGARLLIKYAESPSKAVEIADLAAYVLENSELVKDANSTPNSTHLLADVYAMQGNSRAAKTNQEPEFETRHEDHEAALNYLKKAQKLNPDNFEHAYHLAYLHLELRDVDSSLIYARKAAEIDSSRKEAWHLIALVLSAKKDLSGSLDVINVALDTEPTPKRDDDDNEEKASDEDTTPTPDTAQAEDTKAIKLKDSHDIIENTDRALFDLQIRLTRNIITEALYGHDEGLNDLQQIFQDFAYLAPQAETTTDSFDDADQSADIDEDPSKRRHTTKYSSNGSRRSSRFSSLMSRRSLARHRSYTSESVQDEISLSSLTVDETLQKTAVTRRQQQQNDSLRVPSSHFFKHHKPGSVKRALSLRSTNSGGGGSSEQKSDQDEKPKNLVVGATQDTDIVQEKRPASALAVSTLKEEEDLADSRRSIESLRSYVSVPNGDKSSGSAVILNGSDTYEKSISTVRENNNNIGGNENNTPFPTFKSSIATFDPDSARQMLIRLWLMSAATFRRSGKLDECKDAIKEAETLDPTEPAVWIQLALYYLAISEQEWAVICLQKALSFPDSGDNVVARVHLASIFINDGSVELAEGILRHVTETKGWDIVEAWHLLGRCYAMGEENEKARDVLEWALKLEDTRPIRDLKVALPRCL